MNVRVQVKQWGNSKAVRLPSEFASLMNLETGDFLELGKIDQQTMKLVIVPQQKPKKRLTLAERMAMTKFDQLPVDEEWDLMQPVENEA